MKVLPSSTLVVVALAATCVNADKDTDYYPGYTNPNVQDDMFWKDSINVLQDLDQFQSLYVKYHGCVWSPNGNGQDNQDIGCGSDEYGDDSEYWYLGKTQCYRANVAFSLYGVLADGTNSVDVTDITSNCNEYTYIQSFFTMYGVEAFADPLGIDTTYANSECTSEENENGDSSYTSVTTGCSAKSGIFVQAQFEGAYCHGHGYLSTLDTLTDFNDAIESQTCVKVYEYGNGGVAQDILSQSTSCSVLQFPQQCPDPYGIKKARSRNLQKAAASTRPTVKESGARVLPFLSAVFALGGIAMLTIAFLTKRKIAAMTPSDSKARGLTVDSDNGADDTPIPVVKVLSSKIQETLSQGMQSVKSTIQSVTTGENQQEDENKEGDYNAPKEEENKGQEETGQTDTSPVKQTKQDEETPKEEAPVDNKEASDAILAEQGVAPTTAASVTSATTTSSALDDGKKKKKKGRLGGLFSKKNTYAV